ncbi:MAG TPA: S1 RNA-binding domain-containing protein [Leptospiraceae bacterium]|nr:S1 RNA-binding domain-containing protein [Leptospiraceae bacterium]HMZ57765.1 S1 RNA-binding domain-containing protein [Leptospiraceae bacterium]HNF14648.1 S1 RNA-binding domain-containing protein [Leptospiraceae bacterium]HNF23660.1 S1 RNA-binding domain-containing protein [Leptospiraceae bacterium]HNH08153.1 S1 RNA-binding domain-containing protein [Leptospiraceae bacterium]
MKNSFAELLEESFKKRKTITQGSSHEVLVLSVQDDYVFIKSRSGLQGIIAKDEFLPEEVPSKGKQMNAFFLKEVHGDYYFTVCLQPDSLTKELLELARENEIPILGQLGIESNGGYEIKLGEFSGFCPASQFDLEKKGKNLTGQKIKFVINDINEKTWKLSLSQKRISDKEKALKVEILQSELKEGSFVSCTVKSIHNFGLIVDMNGLDALVPISEASFKKNPKLDQEFSVGQKLRAKVLNLDWSANKFSLSLKDSLEDPWSKKIPFKEGDIVKAEVDSIKPFGLFIRFNENFHGLVPNKETGLAQRVPLANHFKPGDPLDVFILEVNPVKRQIAASIVKAAEAKERLEYESYLNTQAVSNVSSFGLALKKSLKK